MATLGEETLLKLNPDYILYPEKSMGGEAASFKGRPWTDLKAVQQGKLVSFNDDWVLEQAPSYARHGRTLSESGPAKTQC